VILYNSSNIDFVCMCPICSPPIWLGMILSMPLVQHGKHAIVC
jgi:hypothetical protein